MGTTAKFLTGILIIGVIFISGCGEEEKQQSEEQPLTEVGLWTKHPENPALKGDLSSSWAQLLGDPFVMKEGDVYKMWYGAHIIDGITQIGYATSEDGINWKPYPDPVVPVGPNGSWDDVNVETPTIIKNSDGTYELWYSGTGALESEWIKDGKPNFEVAHKIGYATSKDGIHWNKHPNPVLNINPENQTRWDWLAVADPSVIKVGNVYKMWYTGVSLNKDNKMILQIGYATSTDGTDWKRYKNNPVLPLGKEGSWDAGAVMQPSVFFDGEKYIMLYAGSDKLEQAFGSIGYAISKDGINWERSPKPILLPGRKGSWDSTGIWGPTGMFDDDIYKMWYSGLKIDKISGIPTDLQSGIGYATWDKGIDER